MEFEWSRQGKTLDQLFEIGTEHAHSVILEYYDVDSLSDLSEEQVAEISAAHSEEDDTYISMAYNNILESI